MFHIIVHCKPKKDNNEFFGKVIGAYASILIDYKDFDGVMELSKFYVEGNGWEVIEIGDACYTFETKEDLSEDYQPYFDEVAEYGYTMIFNTYESEEDDDE